MNKEEKKLFPAKVSFVEDAAVGVKKITFELNGNFLFSAGQYVWVEIPKISLFDDPRGSRRAFSICNISNKENTISIIGKISESGYKKNLFSLKFGDEVIIHGPFGSSFILPKNYQENIVMVAGGVGIAPFLSIIENIKKELSSKKIFLIYLNKDQESSAFLKELEGLKKTSINFDYKLQYRLFSLKDIKDAKNFIDGNSKWWISGNQAMVNHVFNELKKQKISSEDMVFEDYYPTADCNSVVQKVISKYKKEDILMMAIQNSTNHTIITDINGVVLFANKAACEITGYSEKEILGNTPRLWGGMMSSEFYKNVWTKIQEGFTTSTEITNRRKNGETYYAIVHISPIRDSKNRIVGFIGNEEDITKQKMETEKIRKYLAKEKAILASIGDGLVISNKLGITEMINHTAEVMLGYSDKEAVGMSIFDLVQMENEKGEVIPDENRPLVTAFWECKTIRSEATIIRKDKSKFIASVIASPVLMDNNTIGVIDIIRDITKEKEIDKAKTEFVSLASHQLRTPLTAVKWYSEMLLDKKNWKLEKKQAIYLNQIYHGNEREIKLVDNLLNVSRIELGKIIPKNEIVDISKLLKSVLDEQKSEVVKRKHKLIVEQSDKKLEISTDAIYLRIIFQNLISNAIKYTLNKGEIICGIKKDNSRILFSVKDNGVGIPKVEQPRIFEKLFRASTSLSLDKEGNGLGMYIVKKIAETLGGKVWFESNSDPEKGGTGSTFYLELPIKNQI